MRREALPSRPTIKPERDWSQRNGNCLVAGIDEAGRGPIAGPVVAAAVIWGDNKRPPGITDSKQLTAAAREKLFPKIQRAALAFGIGICTAQEIDAINILEATRLASRRAVEALSITPGALVTDALTIPALALPILPIVKGDCYSASIAAASILAKVTRDRMMDHYHEEFPMYGWNANRGYPTAEHYKAVEEYGPTTLHRLTFSGVGFFCSEPLRSPTFHRLAQMLDATPLTADALLSFGELIEGLAERLPPPDRAELHSLRDRRVSMLQ